MNIRYSGVLCNRSLQNDLNSLKNPPPRKPVVAPKAPVGALERPQGLKRWSSDLVKILEKNRESVFEGWDFDHSDLTRADFTRTMKKIHGCGSVVELRSKVCRETGIVAAPNIHAANFCGQHTICPFCAGRIQDRRKARFREPILNAARTYKHAYLVTATIPPVPTWREDLKLLLGSWQAFRKMGQKRKGRKSTRSNGEWSKIMAGISKVELKRGEGSGEPHCHIHALFFTNEYLDFRIWSKAEKEKARADRESLFDNNGSKISREWNVATDGLATGLDVRKIKWKAPKRHGDESFEAFTVRKENWSLSESVFEQSREVLKYATKFDSAPETGAEKLFAKDYFGIKSATYGRRLFQTYGAFRGVGGDDFTDSACPLSENPVIYEARWQTDRYSALQERTRPVFANRDPGPRMTERLQKLNRVQGATRRMRRSINEAKRHFLETGVLIPAEYSRREFLPEGGFVDHPVALEMPAGVIARPRDLDTWEEWVNEATDRGREAYGAAREELDGESHFRQVGTPEERRQQDNLENRIYWHTEEYRDSVVRSFLQVLAASSPPR